MSISSKQREERAIKALQNQVQHLHAARRKTSHRLRTTNFQA
jgi:hypothetical protein